jgi:hypothetical protein
MRQIYKNLYKRSDVFSCPHSSHHRFGSVVTPHHILNEKKCYPDGCIVFKWKCRLLDKGHRCPKKIKHVGRLCFSCKEFYDEKFMQSPRMNLTEKEYRRFQSDLEDLNLWLDDIVGKEIELEGVIESIKPNFRMFGAPGRERFSFTNWLAVFKSAHINYDLFDDRCFARISAKTQQRFELAPGDRILCRAEPSFSRGRLVFNRLHNMEVSKNGNRPEWRQSTAEVAAATAVRLSIQPEKCLECRFGCLIDDNGNGRRGNRSLLCLAGQRAPKECVYPLRKYVDRT